MQLVYIDKNIFTKIFFLLVFIDQEEDNEEIYDEQ
jgi:hypothetical protein